MSDQGEEQEAKIEERNADVETSSQTGGGVEEEAVEDTTRVSETEGGETKTTKVSETEGGEAETPRASETEGGEAETTRASETEGGETETTRVSENDGEKNQTAKSTIDVLVTFEPPAAETVIQSTPTEASASVEELTESQTTEAIRGSTPTDPLSSLDRFTESQTTETIRHSTPTDFLSSVDESHTTETVRQSTPTDVNVTPVEPELSQTTETIRHPSPIDELLPKTVVVKVEILHQCIVKPFLGGYRNKITGVEYHHATSQSMPKRRPDKGVEVFCRDTQTVEQRSQAQNCPHSVSTQMTRSDCYVSTMNDKLAFPGTYVTAEEYHARRLKAVICLQAFCRGWRSRQAVWQMKRERARQIAWVNMLEWRKREDKEEQLRDRCRRQMNPQKKEDFKLLYHALEKWRTEEEMHIDSTLRGAARKAALCSLLEQEMDLIATIGRHRIAVRKNNYNESVKKFLEKSAAPHQWLAADGRPIEMDTPFTIRARELKDLYNYIIKTGVSHEERFHILMTLKYTVKEYPCELTQDILDLIEREVHLMGLDLKASKLEGLRQRISTLFLQFIKTPAFNPEVAKLLKVPQDSSKLKNNMVRCWSCHRYLCVSDFMSSSIIKLSSRCLDCVRLENIARSRDDFCCYKNILRRLRLKEKELNPNAEIPSMLEVEDVQYLVEVVWQSRSAINSCTNLCDLVFVRWEKFKDWSPWNCILLCEEELQDHLEVEDVHETYEVTFIRRVEYRHLLARYHFSQMPYIPEDSYAAIRAIQIASQSTTPATEEQTSDATKSASEQAPETTTSASQQASQTTDSPSQQATDTSAHSAH